MNTTEKIFIGRVGILLMGMLLFGFLSARAYDFKSGDLWYNIVSEQERTVEVAWFEYSNNEPEKYEKVVVPASVQFNDQTYTVCGIGEKAFYVEENIKGSNETPLKTVELPSTIKYLGNSSFEGCDKLTEINFPEGLVSIGDKSFYCCRSLDNVFLPNTVTQFGTGVFCICDSLSNIRLSENITELIDTFYGCDSLVSITIPESVALIASSCFHWCENLKEIFIGSKAQLAPNIFFYCTSLKEINISPENPYYTSVDGMILSKDKKKLFAFPGAYGEWVKLPDYITTIETYAFFGRLKTLELPSSLEYMEDDVCPDVIIDMVICHATVPPEFDGAWLSDVFGDIDRLTPIYVPTESYNLYKETKWRLYNLHPMSEIAGVEAIDTEAPAYYRVVSLDGKIVMETQNRSDLESLPKGIYIVNGKKIMK